VRAGNGVNGVRDLGGEGWGASVDRNVTRLDRLRFRVRRDGDDHRDSGRQRDDRDGRRVLAIGRGGERTVDLSVVVVEEVVDEVGGQLHHVDDEDAEDEQAADVPPRARPSHKVAGG
jgi:hypothetical protein